MDITSIVNTILPIVFIIVGIALVFFVIELIKILKVTRQTLEDVKPQLDTTMQNVSEITASLEKTMPKVDPMVDSLQLTVDAVNLELMRVDQILEGVGEITDNASSAVGAVDTIANAPVKAAGNVATYVRKTFGSKKASDESKQLGEQREAVESALEDYKAAEAADEKMEATAEEPAPAEEASAAEAPVVAEAADEAPKSYVKPTDDDSELVIDPKVIAESAFFDGESDAR